ncbi:MAG TPA: hypothetical protein VIL13_06650 [Longimicrobiales bacterium]
MSTAGAASAELQDSEVWRSLSDGVVAGICHDLTGRLTALSGIVYLGRLEGRIDGEIAKQIEAELDRLELSIRLLRLLREGGGRLEPIQPLELVGTVLRLFQRHRDLGHLEVEVRSDGADLPPVMARWAELCKAVLVVVVGAAREARAAGATRLALEVRGEGGVVVLALEVPAAPGVTAKEAAESVDAVRGEIAKLGGAVEVGVGDGGGRRFEIRLPAIPCDEEI